MSPHFSESTLNQIRERIDLVDLVGQYVQLKKQGKNYAGLCPFHKEKSASFSVEPSKQFYYCFACNKGGNVFNFLTEVESIPFPDAVRRLAKQAGVEIKEEPVRKSLAARSESYDRLYEILDLAARYFRHLLMEKKEYKHVLEYIQSRGISRKTLEIFRIGASPNGYHGFQDIALERGFSHSELVASGLLIEKQDHPKHGYDRFRSRLMFPLVNREGNVIGFGARILDEKSDQPKYLNSSESPVFSKRRNLYGLFENQRGIRMKEEAVIVEGYMDVVGLYEAGVHNAVASMGTALTEEHLRELRPLTRNLVTVFDPDEAGIQAFQRSMGICLQEGFVAKNLNLHEGLDPDEYVRKEGAEKFYSLCEKAPTQVSHYLREVSKKGPLSPTDTEKALKDLMPVLIASRKTPARALLWDDISLVLKIGVSTLRELTDQESQRSTMRSPVPQKNPPIPNGPSKLDKAAPSGLLDQEFLLAAVQSPEKFLSHPTHEWESAIKSPEIKKWLVELSKSSGVESLKSLAETLIHANPDSTISGLVLEGLFNKEAPDSRTPLDFDAVFNRLLSRKKELRIKILTAEVKLAQRSGDPSEQLRLLQELQDLRTS